MATILMRAFVTADTNASKARVGSEAQPPKWLSVGVALAFVFGIALTKAWADERPTNPDIGPSTINLYSEQIKYQIIPPNEEPPRGFEQPGFDATAFSTGPGPFGSGGNCPLQSTVATEWPTNTQLLVRRIVSIPAGAENVRITVSVDNDILGVFFNGTRIAGFTRHDECPILHEFRFDIAQSLVRSGENLVAFHVVDRGDESFFDAQILAELSPDQWFGAVAVQPAPLVPVRDVAIDTSIQGRAVITYAVAATGEFGEIRIEQLSPDTVTVASFLGNELIASGTATPDTVTMSRSLRGAERLADLDPGILSAPSVLANQTVVEGLFQFGAPFAALSCEEGPEGCNRRAAAASLIARLGSDSRTSGSRSNVPNLDAARVPAEFLTITAEATIHQRIEERRKKCLAACPVPQSHKACQNNSCVSVSGPGADECSAVGAACGVPPAQLPGQLAIAFIFDSGASNQPFSLRARFSGQGIPGSGGTGMTSFDGVTQQQFGVSAVGQNRTINFNPKNLVAGTWRVSVVPEAIAPSATCVGVMVPSGGLRLIRINVTGREPLCQ
jgi:hypothetical protein